LALFSQNPKIFDFQEFAVYLQRKKADKYSSPGPLILIYPPISFNKKISVQDW